MLCVTCAPSSVNLQWRMTLFTPEFTTWIGLPTHKHYILSFTSAHWLSTQLDFKMISGHWVKILSINETAGKSLVHNVITCCLSFSQYVPRNDPSGLVVLQTNQLIAIKPNMTGKVTFSVFLHRMCRQIE